MPILLMIIITICTQWVHNPNKSRPEVLYRVDDMGHKEALFSRGRPGLPK
jgi:hypothetical protein